MKVSKTKMFFVPNCVIAIEERREEIQKARDIAKKMLEKEGGTVTARIKQCVTVKCYSTLFPHDSYKRNAVKHALEPILDLL